MGRPERHRIFRIHPDLRRCASPLCGGWWVSRVNHDTTRDASGEEGERAYVAELDWSAVHLSKAALGIVEREMREGSVLLDGRIVDAEFEPHGNLGRFAVRRVWRGLTPNEPDESFYALEDLGIECVTTPCFRMRAHLANHRDTTDISGLDLADVAGGDDEMEQIRGALAGAELLVNGTIRDEEDAGPGGTGRKLWAKQVWVPIGLPPEDEDAGPDDAE